MLINQTILSKLDIECQNYGAQWIAVTKTQPVKVIEELYQLGKKVYGENKAQELCDKYLLLPHDIDWHFIGHLQTNKVKQIVDKVSTIHAVDSVKLLNEIQKEASKVNRIIKVFIQMHIADEETKYGFSQEEIFEFFQEIKLENFPNVTILGLMAMASFTTNKEQIRKEFNSVRDALNLVNSKYLLSLKELSIGMSGDYTIALECGATWIRVGSLLYN